MLHPDSAQSGEPGVTVEVRAPPGGGAGGVCAGGGSSDAVADSASSESWVLVAVDSDPAF